MCIAVGEVIAQVVAEKTNPPRETRLKRKVPQAEVRPDENVHFGLKSEQDKSEKENHQTEKAQSFWEYMSLSMRKGT